MGIQLGKHLVTERRERQRKGGREGGRARKKAKDKSGAYLSVLMCTIVSELTGKV